MFCYKLYVSGKLQSVQPLTYKYSIQCRFISTYCHQRSFYSNNKAICNPQAIGQSCRYHSQPSHEQNSDTFLSFLQNRIFFSSHSLDDPQEYEGFGH